jgi:DNA-3-methyladenine glycosylase
MKLQESFYSRDTEEVAKDLLGKILVHKTEKGVLSGKIVETEAYFGSNDPASHAYRKKTKRNFLMFESPGKAYVYLCYGNYWLFNIVAKENDAPGAVLVRALEPIKGIAVMKTLRKTEDLKSLTSGPGKLTQALEIGKTQNGVDLTKGRLFLEGSDEKVDLVKATRIGINHGKSRLLRFYVRSNPYVSRI